MSERASALRVVVVLLRAVVRQGAAGGVDVELGDAGALAQLGVAPRLGVAHVQVNARDEARVPRLGRLGALRGDAHGEQPQVAEADRLAVEHQLFQAGEHVVEDAVDDAARVGRVVF